MPKYIFKVGDKIRYNLNDAALNLNKDRQYQIVGFDGSYPVIKCTDPEQPLKYKTTLGEGTMSVNAEYCEPWVMSDRVKYGKFRPGDIVVLKKDKYHKDWKTSYNWDHSVPYKLIKKRDTAQDWIFQSLNEDPASQVKEQWCSEIFLDFDEAVLKEKLSKLFA